jgi:hypothetical protein
MAQAQREVAEYEDLKREIAEWLGLEGRASTLAVRRRLNELRVACDADARVRDADAKLSRAHSAVSSALALLSPPRVEAAA